MQDFEWLTRSLNNYNLGHKLLFVLLRASIALIQPTGYSKKSFQTKISVGETDTEVSF